MSDKTSYEFAYLPAKTLTLKEVRGIYDLKQVDVAKILGCTQSRISKIDNNLVDLNHLVAVAEFWGQEVNISLMQIIRTDIPK
jgi:predicted XRE-type DNA-binding protein